jgi:hypothetical protein
MMMCRFQLQREHVWYYSVLLYTPVASYITSSFETRLV